jgi:hypothetical protein
MTPAQQKRWEAERRAAERHWEYLCRNDKKAPAPKSELVKKLEAALQEPKRLPWEKQ